MSRCSKCKGSGFEIRYDPETKEDTAYPCECRLEREKRDSIRTKLVKACIPPKYWEYDIENYSTCFTSAMQKANEVSIDKLKGMISNPAEFIENYDVLWIWGEHPNAGHTSLAIILATELLKHKYKVRYLRMQELISAFTDFDKRKEFFSYLDGFDSYLIDDAFDSTRCIASGDYSRIHLFNWLSTALSNKKHFICTSKVDIPQIDKLYEQSKNVLLKSYLSLNFQGTIKKNV